MNISLLLTSLSARVKRCKNTFHLNRALSRLEHSPARIVIFHALTYHAPIDVQQLTALEKGLPEEKELRELTDLQKSRLSFTVYSLKQMTAAGTISAETAWTLFNWQWSRIRNVRTDADYSGERAAFWQNARTGFQGEARIQSLSLLEFEFYARAGKAGLAQYQRYSHWADHLEIEASTCHSLSIAVRDEYKKALWLEMRLAEAQMGISGLNSDISKFALSRRGKYSHEDGREIRVAIDIFSLPAESIDAGIKAEVGHWMFSMLNIRQRRGITLVWDFKLAVAELMDSMNIAAYTPRVNAEKDSPEGRTFWKGGYFYTSRGQRNRSLRHRFPAFPTSFPKGILGRADAHETAEYFEDLIRARLKRAVKKGELDKKDAYATYKKMGLYIALLDLEGRIRNRADVENAIESFDLNAINRYFESYKTIARAALEKILRDEDSVTLKQSAAETLKILGVNP